MEQSAAVLWRVTAAFKRRIHDFDEEGSLLLRRIVTFHSVEIFDEATARGAEITHMHEEKCALRFIVFLSAARVVLTNNS